MKITIAASILTLALTSLCNSAYAESSGLDWLLGCWAAEDGSSREVWVRESDEQLIGFGVALSDGQVVFHEVLSVRFDESGIHYTAYPEGQAPATFTAGGASGKEISFTNAGHDYPQRIDYRLEPPRLRARISLLDGSDANEFVKLRCK